MKFASIFFLGLLWLTLETSAQSDRATIVGTVRDASGAAIAGTQVIVTNMNNHFQFTTATDTAGRFTLLNLPIGQYTLVCMREGFDKYERTALNLAIKETVE